MKTLNSNWITGFIDGDGTFALEKVRGFYRPVLSLPQNDPQLLYKIKKFFGCGTVTKKNKKILALSLSFCGTISKIHYPKIRKRFFSNH